jgi:hypothetical protein
MSEGIGALHGIIDVLRYFKRGATFFASFEEGRRNRGSAHFAYFHDNSGFPVGGYSYIGAAPRIK